jgi:hypothetical protein
VPKRRLNMPAVRNVFGPLRDSVAHIDRRLAALPIQRATAEARAFVQEVRTQAQELRRLISEVMS